MEIKNYDEYTLGMQKSLDDKLFFMNMVDDMDTVLDYGCADGSLLREIDKRIKGCNLIGYDIDDTMISKAKENVPDCVFDESFCSCKNFVQGKTLLNLSGVIHEVYSYSTQKEIELFWHRVFNSGFEYIAIRDFCIGKISVRRTTENDYKKIFENGNMKNIVDYEYIWGSVEENKNMLHYLMKYRYKSNWDREVRENYFPITLEELLSKIPTSEYEIIYFNHYILPFTKEVVKGDFDIDITDNTHLQLLLRKK